MLVLALCLTPALGASTGWSATVAATATPSTLLGLQNWYLTLPVANPATGWAQEIKQPALATFSDQYFYSGSSGVVLVAPVGGATTSGSTYPRSELREMVGSAKASWSSSVGLHVMDVIESVDVAPPVKPQVVCAQIHNSSSDVIEVLYDGFTHSIAYRFKGTESSTHLINNYLLGTPFHLTVKATGGQVSLYIDGILKATRSTSQSGLYFKAGAYTQSNPSKGDALGSYGQVTISALQVTHT